MWRKLFNRSTWHSGILFIYLFVVNFLIFNEEENITSITLITIFTTVFYIGLKSIAKPLSFIFSLLYFLVFIPFYIAQELFGLINPSQMMAVYFTNSAETFSYIATIPFVLFAKAFFVGLPLLFLNRLAVPSFDRKVGIILTFIPLFYTTIKIYNQKDYLISQKNKYYFFKTFYVAPTRVIMKVLGVKNLVEKEIEIQKNLQKQPSSWKISKVIPNNKITVVVIGESVRKDFLQIYNPKLSNTPFLSKTPKIQFDNAISYAPRTIQSLTNAFQERINDEPYFPNNIITLTKTAGKKTIWLSNQGSVGENDNYIAAIGKQADKYEFLTSGTFETFKNDEYLLSLLQKNFVADTQTVYFLHMIGSHPSPCSITKDEYQKVYSSKDISCYVESIYRTDQFLEKLYTELQKLNKPFQIIYFSDHGLYLNPDKALVHRNEYKQNYEIPLLILDSELTHNLHIQQNRNLKDFLQLYCELLKIDVENIETSYRFLSEEKDKNWWKLYNNKNFYNLENNPFTP